MSYTHDGRRQHVLRNTNPEAADQINAWLDLHIEGWKDMHIVSLTVCEGPVFQYVCVDYKKKPIVRTLRRGRATIPFPLHAALAAPCLTP